MVLIKNSHILHVTIVFSLSVLQMILAMPYGQMLPITAPRMDSSAWMPIAGYGSSYGSPPVSDPAPPVYQHPAPDSPPVPLQTPFSPPPMPKMQQNPAPSISGPSESEPTPEISAPSEPTEPQLTLVLSNSPAPVQTDFIPIQPDVPAPPPSPPVQLEILPVQPDLPASPPSPPVQPEILPVQPDVPAPPPSPPVQLEILPVQPDVPAPPPSPPVQTEIAALALAEVSSAPQVPVSSTDWPETPRVVPAADNLPPLPPPTFGQFSVPPAG